MKPYVEQVNTPSLDELRNRPCSLAEVQAMLVKLIDLYNAQGKAMNEAINRKQDKPWRATI